MRPMIELWRNERGARAFFVALAQGSLGAGAGYVAVMLVAYERLGSAWAASLILLPSMLLGPLIGAWLDRRDRRLAERAGQRAGCERDSRAIVSRRRGPGPRACRRHGLDALWRADLLLGPGWAA
jgi:hypothetical protein